MSDTDISVENRDLQDCITDCKACHDVCLVTIQHCLRLGGKNAEQRRIRLIADCSELTQTTANFMLRGSDQHHHVCRACAAVCERCAEYCGPLAEGDVQLQACVESCRRCAASCRIRGGGEAVLVESV